MKQPPVHAKPKRRYRQLTAVLLALSLLCLTGCQNAAPRTPESSTAAARTTSPATTAAVTTAEATASTTTTATTPAATAPPSTTAVASSSAEPAPETTETSETTAAAEQMAETEAQPETETEAEPEPETQPENSYVLNTNSKKFHLPHCGSVKKMKDKNRKDVVDTRDNIISQGYAPCKKCCP